MLSRGNQSPIVRAERRNISDSNEVHRRYQNNIYITGCIAGENIEVHWNVDGKRELSDAWTDFSRFILLNERPLGGYTWSGWRRTRKQTTSRPDNVWPDMWKHMSDAAKQKAKQRWTIEKPKLDNARQLRGIFLIEPNDEEFKLAMKAARRKLEAPKRTAIPCKKDRSRAVEKPTAILGNARQNTLVLLMPTKARDQGLKELDTSLIKITSLQKG